MAVVLLMASQVPPIPDWLEDPPERELFLRLCASVMSENGLKELPGPWIWQISSCALAASTLCDLRACGSPQDRIIEQITRVRDWFADFRLSHEAGNRLLAEIEQFGSEHP